MKNRGKNNQIVVWYLKLALYRIWRLRRAILLIGFLPLLVVYAAVAFHPVVGPIFLPNLVPSSPEDFKYVMTFEDNLRFIAGLLKITLGSAGLGAVLFPSFMGFAATMWVPACSLMFLLPWFISPPVQQSAVQSQQGAAGTGVIVPLVIFAILWLASKAWQQQWRFSISFPGTIRGRTCTYIDRSPCEVLEAEQYGAGYDNWNELVADVRQSPANPCRRVIRYVTGGESWLDIVSYRVGEELIVQYRCPVRRTYLETVTIRTTAEGSGTRLESMREVKGIPLLMVFSLWATDFYTDGCAYFRDRLEGRRSLTNKAAILRSHGKKNG